MTTERPDNWYAFHFGSRFVNSPEFEVASLHANSREDCYVMMADLCSFSAFFKATEQEKVAERMMTRFYSETRKAIHNQHGMLDKIVGDAVIAVWGLHHRSENMLGGTLIAAVELVAIARAISEEWQAHVDEVIEPKGLKVGVSKGRIMMIPRDFAYPGLSLLGNPLNLASRLQLAAQPNQLVCSNQVYQDAQRCRLDYQFEPYQGAENEGQLGVRNTGTIKAWVTSLA